MIISHSATRWASGVLAATHVRRPGPEPRWCRGKMQRSSRLLTGQPSGQVHAYERVARLVAVRSWPLATRVAVREQDAGSAGFADWRRRAAATVAALPQGTPN